MTTSETPFGQYVSNGSTIASNAYAKVSHHTMANTTTTYIKEGKVMQGIDFETFCEISIKDVGLDRYVSHPSFQVLIAEVDTQDSSESFDWILGNPVEETHRLFMILGKNPFIVGHNVQFEMACLRWLAQKYGIDYDEKRFTFYDSAVASRKMGGSSDLAHAARQFLISDHKMGEGKRLINKFSMGTCPAAKQVRNDQDWQMFHRYCASDAYLGRRIQEIADVYIKDANCVSEQVNDEITREMNLTGWPVDVDSVFLMKQRYEDNLAETLSKFTQKYGPLNFNSFPQQQKWCNARGMRPTSFDEQSVEMMLMRVKKRLTSRFLSPEQRQNLEEVQEFLETKRILGGSSLSKLDTLIRRIGHDARLRNEYVHLGASQTYRTSGNGVQMQNLKRLTNKRDMAELADHNIEWSNDDLASNFRQLFTSADPGGQLIVADFSSVEARGLAYLSGQEDVLKAFWEGKDLYKVQAAKSRGLNYEDVDDEARRFGKVGVLSCGYGAGWRAVQSFALKMGVDLDESEARDVVDGWRETNQHTVAFWHVLDRMLKKAIGRNGGTIAEEIGNDLKVVMTASAPPDSVDQLQSGTVNLSVYLVRGSTRFLAREFVGAYLVGETIVYHKPDGRMNGTWTDEYRDPKTKRKTKYTIYGGKLAGILTQSLCRELFFWQLQQVRGVAQKLGLDLIGQFHDEVILDWQPSKATCSLGDALDAVETAMTTQTWLPGFPLAAEVKHDYRYIK